MDWQFMLFGPGEQTVDRADALVALLDMWMQDQGLDIHPSELSAAQWRAFREDANERAANCLRQW